MSTIDPLSDFYLPGPAAKENAESDRVLRDPGRDEGDRFSGLELPDEVDTRENDVTETDTAEADEDEVSERPAQPLLQPRRRAAAREGRPTARAATPPGKGVGSLVIAACLLTGMLAGGWYLVQPETLPIRQVSIEGEFQQLSQMEMRELVGSRLQGGFFSIDVAGLQQAIKANPWVRDVQVQRVWPDALNVAVREQVAVARWNDSGLVNSTGDYFQPDTGKAPAGLPQINGPGGMQKELTARLLQLQEGLAPLGLEVKQLTLSDRRAWSFVTTDGLEVVLGRDDFDARLARFTELVPASLGEKLDQASYIDMRYTNGFAVQFNHEGGGVPDGDTNEGNGAA